MALIHLSYFSPALTKNMQLYVALPEFDHLPAEKLKTVWMLHGYTVDYTDWQRLTGMERYAMQRRIAVVMPDGARSFPPTCGSCCLCQTRGKTTLWAAFPPAATAP